MSDDGFRRVALNGVLMIVAGMIIAGFPLVFVVMATVYGQPAPVNPGGDYRGWLMAHLEGLLNGLLVIALAGVVRFRLMPPKRETLLVWALLVTGWGNVIGSICAPIWGVRGMSLNANPLNDIDMGIFGVGFVGTFIAFYIVVRHLWGRAVA